MALKLAAEEKRVSLEDFGKFSARNERYEIHAMNQVLALKMKYTIRLYTIAIDQTASIMMAVVHQAVYLVRHQ